jgi:hypothetical protein
MCGHEGLVALVEVPGELLVPLPEPIMIDMRFSSPGPRDETTASRWERNVKWATSTVALLERSAG